MTKQKYRFETKMIFFRVGWMENYRGIIGGDEISGGGSYISDEGFGHEIFNFQPFSNKVYGYVQPPGRKPKNGKRKANLNRLGAPNDVKSLSNVLVVWVARLPNDRTFIIGWYKNATVFRHLQSPPSGSNRNYEGKKLGYYATAKSDNAHLLDPDERTFQIPQSGEGWMGRSNIWYADNPTQHLKFRLNVLQYINSGKLPNSQIDETNENVPRQPDTDKRQKVEEVAIKKTIDHYTKIGYNVTSVEKDNLGWDLNAIFGVRELKLEVKGLSGSQLTVELTPNEYEKMKKYKTSYRLCVVSQALSNPILEIFSYSFDSEDWRNSNGRTLNIKETVSAICSAN